MATARIVPQLAGPEQSQNTLHLENTEKRDSLVEAEKKYQQQWAEQNVFQQDAPTDDPAKHPKFYGTMAYPYMNGTLHAGHAFTASKIEFATGFARMEGKRALFPQGFHCSGMPIKACADKLAREIEMFGANFERYNDEDDEVETDLDAKVVDAKTDLGKFSGSKSKAVAKTIQTKYQFQIMLAVGVPKSEIHKFADPAHWLNHFPPLCTQDLTAFGARIDWRRSMVTTDANPFYDSFVSWQMNHLKDLGKIKFGKRYTIYSPKDGQPCLDHDRSSGEGVTAQEYTCLKLRTLEWSERAKVVIGDKLPADANVYFVPATLRPETMYGQTCCFVGPKVEYAIFEVSAEKKEYFVLSHRAARNMAFQGIFPKWGVYAKVVDLVGSDLIGTLVNAPLSVHTEGVRILPMETVKPTKGTGIVTCVPSDSPDDYATVLDLAKKAEYYGIQKEWAEKEIIPIIKTPMGDLIAKALYEDLKINSPKDAKQLAEAKETAYKVGFYQGTMIHGPFAGKSVQEAKPMVAKELLDGGLAFRYAEPDGQVISRSADECVAAYLDQWYFCYGTAENGGDGEWCQKVLDYVDNGLNTYYPEARHAFEQTIGWLAQWACSRSYGLGTKLPWDPAQLVESLSDSTIYMAYYTVAHYLHSDIFGKTPGLSKKPITPEQMTPSVWDYIFFRTDTVETDILPEDLESMRREFSYWYPLDIRVSGKDLINNHLTFALYHHVALFDKQYWPKGLRVNGHLMLNGKKMSKSTGNFLTLSQAIEKFGADAVRLALADAGDGIEDANLEESVANASILRLYELKKWSKETLEDSSLRHGEYSFFDKLFENDLNTLVIETRQHYEHTMYKLALKTGFFDLQSSRDWYREQCRAAGVGIHADLARRFVELQALLITPIAPHWADSVWQEILQKEDTIQNALYPCVPSPDPNLTYSAEYVKSTASAITQTEAQGMKKLRKGKEAAFDPTKGKKVTIYVADAFPEWQQKYRTLLQEQFESTGAIDTKAISARVDKAHMKKAMPFVQGLKKRLDHGEKAERVFEQRMPFDEVEVLKEMVPGLKATIRKLEIVQIIRVKEGEENGEVAFNSDTESAKVGEKIPLAGAGANAVPGQPGFAFANV
ncbi:leucine-tRNA ligase [Polytolypa hystricis UAMH7299]|uniref:leucine--tRNA ligase n=1 Tax=Polytolypa hystricis (strain UAMH7299) TaxID=1447883 RepID=A0A2B7WV62_POLH7|nr:leucine-tRNA ligase [Polytolypa hystricis UAMH7299]